MTTVKHAHQESLARDRAMVAAASLPMVDRLSTLSLSESPSQPLAIGADACIRRQWPVNGDNNPLPYDPPIVFINWPSERMIALPNQMLALNYSHLGQQVFVVDRAGHLLHTLPQSADRRITDLCVTADGCLAVLLEWRNHWELMAYSSDFNQQCRIVCSEDHGGPRWVIGGEGTAYINQPTKVAVDRYGNFYLLTAFERRIDVFTPSGALLRTIRTDGLDGAEHMAVSGDRLVVIRSDGLLTSYTLEGVRKAAVCCNTALVGSRVKRIADIAGCAGDQVVVSAAGKDNGLHQEHCEYLVVFSGTTLQLQQVIVEYCLAGSVCIDQHGHLVAEDDDGQLLEIY